MNQTPTTVAIVGARNYPHLDTVRFVVGALSAPVLVGDRGLVALNAAAAARQHGQPVHHLPALADDGTPRWHLRTRRLVLGADALVVFADKPREALWYAMAAFERGGFPVTVYGPEGTAWHPPRSAADPRPNNRPFYIKPNCSYCGTPLVLQDELEGNADVWHDEWMCPTHRNTCSMDWPRWALADLRDMADDAVAHASGEAIDDDLFINAEDIPANERKLTALLRRAKAALVTGKPAAAVKAAERLVEGDPTDYKAHELLAAALVRNGDVAGAVRAQQLAVDVFLSDSIGKPADFQRLRVELRRLQAASPKKHGGKCGKAN